MEKKHLNLASKKFHHKEKRTLNRFSHLVSHPAENENSDPNCEEQMNAER